MCGIAGFVSRKVDPSALPRMLGAIAHRGPDGEGAWRGADGEWRVELGHRRLAIIDLEGGAQPMTNGDGSLVVTYNGELYNYLALRPELERWGHSFRTRSDTETLVHHLEEHGVEGVPALDGMFAFALWDARAERLLLARDRSGIKPLYYAELPDGGLAFGSELSAVLAHGGIDDRLSADGLVSYFFSDYVHPPHTIVRGVRKLPPGHTLVWEGGRLAAPRPFWQIPAPDPAKDGGGDDALAHQLWQGIERAVESQLVSDVPIGIFLSGGLDSSCIAAAAAARAGRRMTAFSIGFENPTFDESGYARQVAAHLGIEHVTETLDERNLLDVVDQAIHHLDEPLADPSYLPTFLLSRLAARHVKVVVGGDGGDELWGGYPTLRAHRYAAVYGWAPAWVRAEVAAGVAWLPIDDRYQSLEWKLRRFVQRWDDDPVRRHLRWMSALDLPDLGAALPTAGALAPATLSAALPETSDLLARIMALDFATYLPGSVLTKVDRASMAHGLEVRPPLLDDQLVELAFRLPSRVRLRGGGAKPLLKRAARGRLPEAVIDRPKKGFGVPLGAWLRGPLVARLEAVLTDSPLWDLGCLDRAAFRGWQAEHQSRKSDRSKPLWALYVLDRWARSRSSARS